MTGRPVKIVLNRGDDFLATSQAPAAQFTFTLAADADGTITAIKCDALFDTGFFSHPTINVAGPMAASWYPAPNVEIAFTEVFTNRVGVAAYRAPGLPQLAFALEQAIDELAAELGISPLDLRLKNVASTGQPMADGRSWWPMELQKMLRQAGEHPAWNTPKGNGAGVGIAIGLMGGTVEPASATIQLSGDGVFMITVGSIDLTGTTTGLTQIAAEQLGIPVDQVKVTTAPSNVAPLSGGTGGSKILYTVGNAVISAAVDAREQVFEIASSELEVSPEDLEIVDGRVRVIGATDQSFGMDEIFSMTSGAGARYGPIHGQGTVANTIGAPRATVHLARVQVERETGEIIVTDYVCFHDVGRAINPAEVRGQIYGGFAQGLSWSMFEELIWDDRGQPITASYMDYTFPKASQIPAIEPVICEYPSDAGPFGVKGIGEPPIIPVAGAVANAVFDATGVRLRRMPMTAERVWQALKEKAGHDPVR